MNFTRQLVLIISLLSIVSVAVAAPPITLEINELDDEIRSDESATFILTVSNNQAFDDAFYISAPRSQWDVSFENYYLPITAGGSSFTSVRMSPPITSPEGRYGIYFEVKSAKDPEIMEYRYVHVDVVQTVSQPEPAVPEEEPEPELITELTITEDDASVGFLRRAYAFTLENTGQTTVSDTWTEIFTDFELLFLSSEPRYTAVQEYGDSNQIVWSYTLEPGESMTLSYAVSYYSLIIAALLLFAAAGLFGYYYTSRFRIAKTITPSKSDKKNLKVEVHIKNKTSRTQKSIRVEDYLPVPFELVKNFDTIEPDSITKHGNYIKLVWKFPELAPKDERVLSYHTHSNLKVVGTVSLPQAALIQRRGKRQARALSGTVEVVGKDEPRPKKK